jgi:transposase
VAEDSTVFVGIDAAKAKHAVAVAEAGRNGEVRYLGEIEASPEAVRKLLTRLAARHGSLHVCYEAGPTGYGLYRQVVALGHACTVSAAFRPVLLMKVVAER